MDSITIMSAYLLQIKNHPNISYVESTKFLPIVFIASRLEQGAFSMAPGSSNRIKCGWCSLKSISFIEMDSWFQIYKVYMWIKNIEKWEIAHDTGKYHVVESQARSGDQVYCVPIVLLEENFSFLINKMCILIIPTGCSFEPHLRWNKWKNSIY